MPLSRCPSPSSPFWTVAVFCALLALLCGLGPARGEDPAPQGSPALSSSPAPGSSPAAPGSPAPGSSPAAPSSPAPGSSPAAPGSPAPGSSPAAPGSPTPPGGPAPATSPPAEGQDPLARFRPTEGIWIADSENGRIVYVADMTGRGFLYLGISGRGVNRFLNPEQVWVSEEGTMFVADAGNNRVVRIYDFLGQGWEEIRGLSHPSGVALYGKKLFVADTGNDRVLVYSSMDSGAQVTYTDPRLIKPTRLWVDAQGQLYVACGEDPPGGRILVIPAEADPARSADWPCYEGQGLRPTGFGPSQAVTSGGPLFIIDASSARLVRVDNLQGRDPRELGGYGSGERRFERPAGLGVDTQGALYVADTGHDRVVKVDDISGRGWTVFDGSGDPQKTLRGPRSVFVWAPRPPRPSPSPSQSPSPSPRSNRFRDQ